jgi:hypothetical protein
MSKVRIEEAVSTQTAVEAVAWERAPRYPRRSVNRRIVCADGYCVSVQASAMHYANDSHPSGEAAYWRGIDVEPEYPFVTFEVANPTSGPEPAEVWGEYDANGVWAWVPREVVADLLDLHGGAVAWEKRSDS